jgi:hypothetical protein
MNERYSCACNDCGERVNFPTQEDRDAAHADQSGATCPHCQSYCLCACEDCLATLAFGEYIAAQALQDAKT